MDLHVIADDLTGACDVGAEFAAAGVATRVHVGATPTVGGAPLLEVVNTQSRGLTPAAAYERVLRLARTASADLLFKKIDTALRGHVGAELEAALDGLGAVAAFVLPAVPTAGRVTRNGAQWFNGVPLGATEFARDPEGCGAESSIAAVLARESRRRTEVISTTVVRSGGLPDRARALVRAGTAFFVVDAETDADLAAAVSGILELPRPLCFAGSIGLARALVPQLAEPGPPAIETEDRRCPAPALIVLGSLHSMARAQSEALVDAGDAVMIVIQPADEAPPARARVVAEARGHVALGTSVVLAPAAPADVPDLRARRATERLLADLCAAILDEVAVPTLVLVGGETSYAVLSRLGTATIAVRGRFAPLVAVGEISSGRLIGATLVTKGGSGGTPETLRALLAPSARAAAS